MGTRERRQREAQRRRGDILNAARKLFWKNGYAGTTMPQIAAAVQLAQGTLYLYFPGKDALYAELLAEGYELLRRHLEATLAKPSLPRQAAGALLDGFLGFARQFPEYFDVIFFLLQKEGGDKSAHAGEQLQRLKAAEDSCKAVAAQVLKQSHYAATSAELVVDAVWSMLAGVVFFFRNDDRYDVVADEARKLILSAVFPSR